MEEQAKNLNSNFEKFNQKLDEDYDIEFISNKCKIR